MRSVIMRALTLAMCGAAILSFGVAQAGSEAATVEVPAGYRVVEEDARISPLKTLNGYTVIDNDTILLRAGASDLYLIDLFGTCGRGARFDWNIAVDARGGAGIDRFARVHINGRTCGISALTKVERVSAPARD